MKKSHLFFNFSAICLSAFFGMLIFNMSVMGHFVSNWWTDYKIVEFSTLEKQDEEIVLVTITEETLAALPYRSPIDRAFLATIITDILGKGAKIIGVDIIIDQATEPAKDQALQKVFQRFGNRISVVSASRQDGLSEAQLHYQDKFLAPVLKMKANLVKDTSDGVVRWRYQTDEGAGILPFVETLVTQGELDHKFGKLENNLLRYPLSKHETPFSFPTYEAQQVRSLPGAWFKDKYILLGVDLADVDHHRTPFSTVLGETTGNQAGIYLHALGLHQELHATSWTLLDKYILSGLALCCALIGFFWVRIPVKTVWKVLLGIAGICVFVSVDVQVFRHLDILLSPIGPVFAGIFSFSISSARHHWQEKKKRVFLHHAFSHYVSHSVIEQLIAMPERLKLGGEQREMTFLFADLEGFTSLSESLAPQALVEILHAYNNLIAHIILKHKGTIDKFAGDGINAFFGAPVADDEHRYNAYQCAIEISRQTQAFAEGYNQKGIAVGFTRIGIHSGRAVVGNFGGKERFQYTVLGDAVNTAARLESLNKHTSTYLMLSLDTVQGVANISVRKIGKFILKGKDTPIEVVEPFERGEALTAYEKFYEEMKKGTVEALDLARQLGVKYQNDPIISFHLKRLENEEKGIVIKMDQK